MGGAELGHKRYDIAKPMHVAQLCARRPKALVGQTLAFSKHLAEAANATDKTWHVRQAVQSKTVPVPLSTPFCCLLYLSGYHVPPPLPLHVDSLNWKS